MPCISSLPFKRWGLTALPNRHIVVWPHLAAAGRPGPDLPPAEFKKDTGHIFRKSAQGTHLHENTKENRDLLLKVGSDHRNWIGKNVHGQDVFFKGQKDGSQVWIYRRDNLIENAGVNFKGRHSIFNCRSRLVEIWNKEPSINVRIHNRLTIPHFQNKNSPPPPGGNGGSGGGPRGPGGPGVRQFQQLLQQTNLVKSYNSTHPNNPMAEKGAPRGEIGGVACSTSYIEGLFNQPEALLEEDHFFCFPALPGGKMPFTDLELGQILRELAIGIYVHSTIPFFSLHFREDGTDLFPVIHPAYEHTLVGKVIGMLDYIMKGYLNGGVYQEQFIEEWHKNPDWNTRSDSALEQLIEFNAYCKEHMEGPDKFYASLASLCDIEKSNPGMSEVLRSFKGFSNSFRIIAKQNSIQKENNLFVVDSDFDVFYDIKPSPMYQQALNEHIRQHGSPPDSHMKMEKIYEDMKDAVHNHMAKMPLCHTYFSMLSVINFFAGYFSTLKKHRKVPSLSMLAAPPSNGCPPLFPHLPVMVKHEEDLQINEQNSVLKMVKAQNDPLTQHLADLFDLIFSNNPEEFSSPKQELLLSSFKEAFEKDVLAICNHPAMRRYMQAQMGKGASQQYAASVLDTIEQNFQVQMGLLQAEEMAREELHAGVPAGYQVEVNIHTCLTRTIQTEHVAWQRYFMGVLNRGESFNPQEKEHLIEALQEEFSRSVLALCTPVVRQFMQSRMEQLQLKTLSSSLWNELVEGFNSLRRRAYSIPNAVVSPTGLVDAFMERSPLIYPNEPQAIYIFAPSLLSQKKELIQNFLENVPFVYPDKLKTICSVLDLMPHLPHERSEKEREETSRVVGGCGLRMKKQEVQSSPLGRTMMEQHLGQMLALDPESLLLVKGKEENSHVVFRLFTEDLPLDDADYYRRLEQLLLTPEKESTDQLDVRLELQDAIEDDDRETFTLLIKETPQLATFQDREEKTLLHFAACVPDPFYVEALLKKGLSLTAQDVHGYLPLHYAAMRGSSAVLKKLSTPATINVASNSGATCLIVAIQHNQVEAVRYLLSKGANLTLLAGGYTTLHSVLHEGNEEMIEVVLSSNQIASCINVSSIEGGTPLMLACALKNKKIVDKLLSLGANPAISRKDGVTALEIAIRSHCLPVVKSLLIDPNPSSLALEAAAEMGDPSLIALLLNHLYAYSNKSNDNALHLAIRSGNVAAALYLIEHCSDPSFLSRVNVEKQMPSTLAAILGIWEVIQAFSHKKAPIDYKQLFSAKYHPLLAEVLADVVFSANDLQKYALIAAQAGNFEALSMVLKQKGANLDAIEGPKGWRLLHYLAKSDALFLFRQQIAKTSDLRKPLAKDGNKTLAAIAAENGSQRVLKVLLMAMRTQRISLEAADQDKHLLYSAIEGGTDDLVFDFFEPSSLINHVLDNQGSKPIHVAARTGSVKALQRLAERGADLKAKDHQNWTALDYSVRAQSNEAVKFLLDKGVPVTIDALYLAASQHTKEIFSLLVQKNRSAEILDGALMRSVEKHHLVAFRLLMKNHASLKYMTEEGWTPTLLASATGQYGILSEILNKLTTPDIRDCRGNSPLHWAALNNHPHCFALLIRAGHRDHPNGEGKTAHELGPNVIEAVTEGLHESRAAQFAAALQEGRWDDVRTLLREIPINQSIVVDYPFGKVCGTPLQLLIHLGRDFHAQEVAKEFMCDPELDLCLANDLGNTLIHLLLEKDISPLAWEGINLTQKNHLGETPIHVAAGHANKTLFTDLLGILKKNNLLSVLEIPDNKGWTPLFHAIVAQKEDNVDVLLEQEVDLRQLDHDLISPLAFACRLGAVNTVKNLLEAGANSNQRVTLKRFTSLHVAMLTNKELVIWTLLAHGVNLNTRDDEGNHLVDLAVEIESESLLRLLKASGATLTAKNSLGEAPKYTAARKGNIQALELLFGTDLKEIDSLWKNPADKHTDIEKQEIEQKTTLLGFACLSGKSTAAAWFLARGANPEIKDPQIFHPLSCAAVSNASLSLFPLFDAFRMALNPDHLCPAIFESIRADQVESMKALYNRGIPIDSKIMEGYTGLNTACRAGALQCSAWLLHKGASPFISLQSGKTALELSATNSSFEQFRLMIEHTREMVDLNRLNLRGETLLHMAAAAGNLGHTTILIQNRVHLMEVDNNGLTPLHAAAAAGRKDIVRVLLACGASDTIRSSSGRLARDFVKPTDILTKEVFDLFTHLEPVQEETLLHRAVRSESLLAMRLLTQLLSIDEINQRNVNGFSALHVAVQMRQKAMITSLIQAGADIDAVDVKGHTPLWIACLELDPTLVQLLVGAGANPHHADFSGNALIQQTKQPELLHILQDAKWPE